MLVTMLLGALGAPAFGVTDQPHTAASIAAYESAYRSGSAFHATAGAAAIPAWARKYSMNCNGCHLPAVPRLNSFGFKFKWAGYRLPEEIGENVEVSDVSDYLAARLRFQYKFSKTEGSSPSTSEFVLNDATLFAGGAFGKHFGAFLEFEHAVGETELVNHVMGVWGSAESYGGARAGQMHWLLRGAVAGFDRPTGISTPIPLSTQLTSALPFKFSTDQLGLEGFWVRGNNRFSAEVLNGVRETGIADEGDDRAKDVAVIDQFLFDKHGSGITAVGYLGRIHGADPSAPGLTSKFTRLAVSANKVFGSAEAMAGYAYGKDTDLPIGVGSAFSTESVKGQGFWVYGGYTMPSNKLTLFGRYEFVDPDTDISDNGRSRFVVGTVLPVSLPEYLRFTAEYTLDKPQLSGSKAKHGLVGEVMINF